VTGSVRRPVKPCGPGGAARLPRRAARPPTRRDDHRSGPELGTAFSTSHSRAASASAVPRVRVLRSEPVVDADGDNSAGPRSRPAWRRGCGGTSRTRGLGGSNPPEHARRMIRISSAPPGPRWSGPPVRARPVPPTRRRRRVAGPAPLDGVSQRAGAVHPLLDAAATQPFLGDDKSSNTAVSSTNLVKATPALAPLCVYAHAFATVACACATHVSSRGRPRESDTRPALESVRARRVAEHSHEHHAASEERAAPQLLEPVFALAGPGSRP